MFGLFDVDNHFMLLNHIMLIAKQTIFLCRQKSITPSFIIFLAHLKKIFRIEEYLAKEKKKLNLHLMKWEKLLQSLSWNNFTLGSLVLIFLFIYLFIYWPYTILFTLYCCNFFFFNFFFNVKRKNTIKYIKKYIYSCGAVSIWMGRLLEELYQAIKLANTKTYNTFSALITQRPVQVLVKGEIFIVIFAGFGVGRGKSALSAITEVCKEGIHASDILTRALLWTLY